MLIWMVSCVSKGVETSTWFYVPAKVTVKVGAMSRIISDHIGYSMI